MINAMVDKFLIRFFAKQLKSIEIACEQKARKIYDLSDAEYIQMVKDEVSKKVEESAWHRDELSHSALQIIAIRQIEMKAEEIAAKVAEEIRLVTLEKISNEISDEFLKANLTKILKDIDVKAVANAVTLKTAGSMLGSQVEMHNAFLPRGAFIRGGR